MERRRNPIGEGHDEDIVLERDRRRNDLRLKSAFESIFARYSRDFTDVGDEIDLETGEIIVNNGHLSYMRDEQDLGEDDAGRLLRSFMTDQEIDNTSTAEEDEGASDRRNSHSNDVLMEGSDSEYADSNYVSEQDEEEQEESEGDAVDAPLMNSVWDDVPDIHGLRPSRRATMGNQIPFNTAALQAFSQTIATQIAQFMVQAFQPGLANFQGRSGSSLPARRRSTRPAPLSPPRSLLRPARLSMPATDRRQRRSPKSRQSIWALPPEYTSPPRKRRSNGQGARRTMRSADGTTPLGGLEVPPASNSTHVAVQDNTVSENWMNQSQALSDSDHEQNETETDHSEVIHLDDRSDEQEDAGEAAGRESVNQESVGIQVTSKHPYSANTKRVRSKVTPKTPFEKEDDDLIMELHLEQKMPWKEIAEYFPGRAQWTLENRYYKYIMPNLAEETRNESKDDMDQIVDLKENQRLSWEEIAERLPHFTPSAARGRYYRKKASAEEEQYLRLRENQSDEDVLLLELRETKNLCWEDIGPHFPDRELNWLKNHYYKNLRLPGTQMIHPNRNRVPEEEDARLLELKHDQGLTWPAIASHFPDRSLNAVQQRYYKVIKRKLQKETPGTGGTSNEELHSQGTEERVTRSSKRNGDAHRDRPQSSPLGVREKDDMSSRSAVQSDPQHEPRASPSSRPDVVSTRSPSPGEDENDSETLAELLARFGHRQPQPAPVKTITSIPTSHQQTPQSALVTWKPYITPQSVPVTWQSVPLTWQSCVTPRSVAAQSEVPAQSEVRTRSQWEKSVKNAAGNQTPVSPKVADTTTARRKRRRMIEDSASEDELAQL